MEDSLTTHEEFKRLRAEVARLQTALEGAEARDRLRRKALEDSPLPSSIGMERYREWFAGSRAAAMDIKPEEAREKEAT